MINKLPEGIVFNGSFLNFKSRFKSWWAKEQILQVLELEGFVLYLSLPANEINIIVKPTTEKKFLYLKCINLLYV
jgi:hypothetical protein